MNKEISFSELIAIVLIFFKKNLKLIGFFTLIGLASGVVLIFMKKNKANNFYRTEIVLKSKYITINNIYEGVNQLFLNSDEKLIFLNKYKFNLDSLLIQDSYKSNIILGDRDSMIIINFNSWNNYNYQQFINNFSEHLSNINVVKSDWCFFTDYYNNTIMLLDKRIKQLDSIYNNQLMNKNIAYSGQFKHKDDYFGLIELKFKYSNTLRKMKPFDAKINVVFEKNKGFLIYILIGSFLGLLVGCLIGWILFIAKNIKVAMNKAN